MRRLAWLILAVLAITLPAGAQKPVRFRQAVQWQVTPDLRVVELGKPVVFILEVRNVSGAPIELRFSSGKQFDVLVTKQGEWSERWQWSRGKAFTMAFSSIRLNFGEVKRFRVEWDQRDNDGRQVPPGDYRVEAILPLVNPQGRREELKASAPFSIRVARRFSNLCIRDLINNPDRWVGTQVFLAGRNAGWQPDPNCPNCAGGPPVTRSDWVLRDDTGCIYVTGIWAPTNTRGQEVLVEGTLRRGRRGQIYVEAKRVFPASPR
ncbi:MAG: hypothetical protein KatS3mg022_0937 [Armatimonadota bacterium]|nr:MAG: hypothetical protein KatS3mg022_0937 [Armatimonadota bacterium]